MILRDLSGEGKRPGSKMSINTLRRVSVSLLRADSGQSTTPVTPSNPPAYVLVRACVLQCGSTGLFSCYACECISKVKC
jgi:hypothetical protein